MNHKLKTKNLSSEETFLIFLYQCTSDVQQIAYCIRLIRGRERALVVKKKLLNIILKYLNEIVFFAIKQSASSGDLKAEKNGISIFPSSSP